jgi:hypothetical protein
MEENQTKLVLLNISVLKKDIQSLSSHKNHPKQGVKTKLTVTSRACKTPFCNFLIITTYFYTELDMENDFMCLQIKLEYSVAQ